MLASCSRLLLVVPPAEICVWVALTSNRRGFGTVCRFGSSIDSRPVAVAVWQKWPLILTRLGPYTGPPIHQFQQSMPDYTQDVYCLADTSSFSRLAGTLLSMLHKWKRGKNLTVLGLPKEERLARLSK